MFHCLLRRLKAKQQSWAKHVMLHLFSSHSYCCIDTISQPWALLIKVAIVCLNTSIFLFLSPFEHLVSAMQQLNCRQCGGWASRNVRPIFCPFSFLLSLSWWHPTNQPQVVLYCCCWLPIVSTVFLKVDVVKDVLNTHVCFCYVPMTLWVPFFACWGSAAPNVNTLLCHGRQGCRLYRVPLL